MIGRRKFVQWLLTAPLLAAGPQARADVVRDYEISLDNLARAAFGPEVIDAIDENNYTWLHYRKNIEQVFHNTGMRVPVRTHVIRTWKRGRTGAEHIPKCPVCQGHVKRFGRGLELAALVPALEPGIEGALWRVGETTYRCGDWGLLFDPAVEIGAKTKAAGRLWYTRRSYLASIGGGRPAPAERAG